MTAIIILRFDAIELKVELFSTTDGSVGAHFENAEIRSKHTTCSLTGYGATADDAVEALWAQIEGMPAGDEFLLVREPGRPRRYYRWNGAAWKQYAADDIGCPA